MGNIKGGGIKIMKIAFFIILYIGGVISVGVYFYKKLKTETITKSVSNEEMVIILLLSLFFPITYLFGLLMVIIEKIGDRLCKDH